MKPDPFSLVLAVTFTARCATIHACRHRPDDVTLVLGLLLALLWNLSGAVVDGQADWPLEPGLTVELASYRPVHD
ncbi:hypothetical protein [Methylobacterium nonmethylotrophicum]|uniref:Uncharacterized protein n=1 Tax=Methylobacterium nonmethylotrophicum TaxID=1141884 RepID=A0A4Z0NPN0_9HYPH|nr:hypothetical protein [Methylobacterium nonmethylotrophicum]TGD97683.1 hypothetical protein EU555_18775 [Methylobacterium nonmethylotrophicum]